MPATMVRPPKKGRKHLSADPLSVAADEGTSLAALVGRGRDESIAASVGQASGGSELWPVAQGCGTLP